ncbi:hypothetical protein EDC04DRAFT_1082225 [Pisolithus marmoratus]|nr:hypothetical protein EDC04DRAFT_1082225 [Pisolithus marmoratus]
MCAILAAFRRRFSSIRSVSIILRMASARKASCSTWLMPCTSLINSAWAISESNLCCSWMFCGNIGCSVGSSRAYLQRSHPSEWANVFCAAATLADPHN